MAPWPGSPSLGICECAVCKAQGHADKLSAANNYIRLYSDIPGYAEKWMVYVENYESYYKDELAEL